jgi:transcription initiation factor IIE alpha subunit
MLSRNAANAAVGRASAMRRMRRRTANANHPNRLYCATNGCTSFLVLDQATSTATCEICGYQRRLH